MALLDLVSRFLGIVAFAVAIERLLHGHVAAAACLALLGLFLGNLTVLMERILRRPGGPWDEASGRCVSGTGSSEEGT